MISYLTTTRRLLCLALFLPVWIGIVANDAAAQRGLKDIPDPDPELQRKELQVHPDFEINLFAADPRIAKPIQMNFDAQGRLWIASSEVYPQIEPGQEANDKILILEDQDRDGQADKTTVFADGLLIPTGVIPGDGGAYVANSTELLHFQDEDGDGVAESERVVLSGFGTEDTHHILHTLRWGPDGLLYMNQSIYIHSHIETPYGVRRMNGGGVWHFRPETLELETYTLGLVNPWGHAIDGYGQSFETDGAGGEGINYVFPGFVGRTSPGAKRIQPGLNPGKPKLCGLDIIGGSHIPEEWQGDLIANDFRAHRVCRYKLKEEGAGYSSVELEELVKSRHQSFRPIDVKLGPDGAIYIADWYNPIIQHGEVDFRDPRRDHTHGRIWRITAKNRKLLPNKNIRSLETNELIELLRSKEPFWRQQARRILKERGADEVLPVLNNAKASFDGRDRLEVLWMYQACDTPNQELLSELLQDEDHRVRAAATRVMYHWIDRIPNRLTALQTLANDDHPRVRMEAAHALRRCDEPSAAFIALEALQKPTDQFLNFALLQTADNLQDNWLPALKDGSLKVEDANPLLFALKAADSPETVPILMQALPQWSNSPNGSNEALELIAARGNPEQLSVVLAAALDEQKPDRSRSNLLRSLIEANRRRKVKPDGDLSGLAKAITSDNQGIQSAASELAGLLDVPEVRNSLIQISQSESNPTTQIAAIRGLAAMKEGGPLRQIAKDDTQETSVRHAAIAGLSGFQLPQAADLAANALANADADNDPSDLVRAILNQDGGDSAMANALKNTQLKSSDVAKRVIRVARSSGRDMSQLVEQLQRAAEIDADMKLTANEQAELLKRAAEDGDPKAGEAVYRLASLNCQKCHAIGGAGGKVGPDLSSIGASAPADYILQSLLDPGAKIKENYHSQVVLTDEGQLVTGVLIRETDNALLLRDAEDNEISIPLDSIEEKKDGGSLMPAGLLNELTNKERIDLLRFLTELGKVGPYAAPNSTLVRTWETLRLPTSSVDGRTINDLLQNEDGWQPIFSYVNGSLRQRELQLHQLDGGMVSLLRFPLRVSSSGEKTLRFLNSAPEITLYVDGKRIPTSNLVVQKFEQGTHYVTIVAEKLNDDDAFAVLVE